jgi:hypothetical protein
MAQSKEKSESELADTITCSPLRPICLNRPQDKNRFIDPSKKINGKTMDYFCPRKDETTNREIYLPYQPAEELHKLPEFLNNKETKPETFSIKTPGDINNNSHCYSVELAWFIVIEDIIKNNNKIMESFATVERSPVTLSSAEEVEFKKTIVENLNNVFTEVDDDINAVAVQQVTRKVELQKCLKIIIKFGIDKWQIKKNVNSDTAKILYESLSMPDAIKAYSNNEIIIDASGIIIPNTIFETNIDKKNDIIAFILLKFFYELILTKGFEVFSDLLDNLTILKQIGAKTVNEKNTSSSGADSAGFNNILSGINEVFKITLFIMNDKNELSNVYYGQDLKTIYNTLSYTFDRIKKLFKNYEEIQTIYPEEYNKLQEDKKIEQNGGSLLVQQLLSMTGSEILKSAAYSTIWGVVQGTWYAVMLPIFSFMTVFVPFVNIIAASIGTAYFLYKITNVVIAHFNDLPHLNSKLKDLEKEESLMDKTNPDKKKLGTIKKKINELNQIKIPLAKAKEELENIKKEIKENNNKLKLLNKLMRESESDNAIYKNNPLITGDTIQASDIDIEFKEAVINVATLMEKQQEIKNRIKTMKKISNTDSPEGGGSRKRKTRKIKRRRRRQTKRPNKLKKRKTRRNKKI